MNEIHYFRYKLNTNLIGYKKIIEKGDFNKLKNCKLKGYNYYTSIDDDDMLNFSIDNQLYRQLKLYKLNNNKAKNIIKFLSFMVKKSQSITEGDITQLYSLYSGCTSGSSGYHSIERDIEDEKFRKRYQNNIYKQKLRKF